MKLTSLVRSLWLPFDRTGPGEGPSRFGVQDRGDAPWSAAISTETLGTHRPWSGVASNAVNWCSAKDAD